jgi:tetratricopeptide (TPR) repeat protein
LRDALSANLSADAKLRVMNNLAMVEWHAGNLSEALNLYSESRVLCESSANCFVLGNYHMNYSIALRAAGRPVDALVEAGTASLQLEQAGHLRHQARVLNNVSMILLDLERLEEAHQKLDQAERLFLRVDDHGGTAQVAETRARVYLAAREYDKAEEFARSAVDILSAGDEKANLVEAMVTHATTLARLKQTVASIERFGKACEIAGQFMNERAVTDITVKLVEELVGSAYLSANVKFEEAILRVEAKLIKEALQRSNGHVTEAAVRLGLKKHQNLCWMLRTRHSDLQGSLEPVQPRRKSQMNKENEGKVVRMRRVAKAH